MYKTFQNKLRLECSRWKAHTGKRIFLMPSSPMNILHIRHLVRHYTACMAVVDMLDAKDPYTADHSRRVADMCLRLAIMMRLPRAQIVQAVVAAGGHDIGKVGVPDRILLKAGALSSQEFEVLKHHPSIGANIFLKISGFEEIAAAVWHHHERWDGTGYPDGQVGADIPQMSRMIALCDSIDAMRSDRSYRKGMSDSDCRQEIEKNAGSMYDPKLASLCLTNWEFLTGNLYVNS